LLRQIEGPGGDARFTMLETIREYALERLVASGEEDAVRAAHLQHMAELAERQWSASNGHESEQGIRRLIAEQGNIRSTLAWALDHAPIKAARLTGALDHYWILSSSVTEGRDWAERTLAAAPELPEHIRARALLTAGWMARCQGDLAGAEPYFVDAAAGARRVGDLRVLWISAGLLGEMVLGMGQLERAQGLYAESRAAAGAMNEPGVTAVAVMTLGRVAQAMGDLAKAQAYLEEAVAAHRASGGSLGIATAQDYLGGVLFARGDENGAARRFRDSLRVYADLAAWGQAGSMLEGIAAATVQRDAVTAARLLGAASVLFDRLDPVRDSQYVAFHDRAVDRSRSKLGDASFTAAWAAGSHLTWAEILADVDSVIPEHGTLESEAVTGVPQAHGLTARERDVLRLVAKGRSNRSIAEELSLSQRTIEHHVLHILTKLDLESRTAAAAWAVRHDLA
jgi:DNA-binding CsgD family transcriptional regulator